MSAVQDFERIFEGEPQPYRNISNGGKTKGAGVLLSDSNGHAQQEGYETAYCLFNSLKRKVSLSMLLPIDKLLVIVVRLRKEIAAGFYFQTAVVFILISHLLLCCVAFVSLIPSTNDSVNVTYLCGVCFVSAFTAFGFLGLHLSISFYVGCFLVLQMCIYWVLLGLSFWSLVAIIKGNSAAWCNFISLLIVIYIYAGSISIVGEYFMSLKPCSCFSAFAKKPQVHIASKKIWKSFGAKQSLVLTTPEVKTFGPNGGGILEPSEGMVSDSAALDSAPVFDSYAWNTMRSFKPTGQ
uniref:MARVEL domain-containing protein n=1 Tax=Ascaris lumbricoides TaxID=6252 RepID=A0A0M3I7D9_ASCLU